MAYVDLDPVSAGHVVETGCEFLFIWHATGACHAHVLVGFLRMWVSGGVRVRLRVQFQVVQGPTFGGFPIENPTKKATASKLF